MPRYTFAFSIIICSQNDLGSFCGGFQFLNSVFFQTVLVKLTRNYYFKVLAACRSRP